MLDAGEDGEVERQIKFDGYTPAQAGRFPETMPVGHPARLAKVVVDHVRPLVEGVVERIRARLGGAAWALESAVATLSRDLSDRERRIREARGKLVELRHVIDSTERGLWVGSESASVVRWRLMDDILDLLSPSGGGVQ